MFSSHQNTWNFLYFLLRSLSTLTIGLLTTGLLFSPVSNQLMAADGVVVILLDDSGSMNDRMKAGSKVEPRMVVAKRALRKLVEQLPEETRLGVLLLNGSRANKGWLVPLEKLDHRAAIAQIEKVTARGGTPLGSSMKTAMDALLVQRREQPVGEYRLLVVTDGEATDESLLMQYLPDFVSRGIYIDVIGVDMQSDHSLAKRSHSYRRADDADSLDRALAEVFAETTHSSDMDAAQADFDLIAGLPDDFAQEVLPVMAKMQSQPIGASQDDGLDSNSFGGGGATPVGASNPAPEGGSWLCPIVFVILTLVAIRVFSSAIFKSGKR